MKIINQISKHTQLQYFYESKILDFSSKKYIVALVTNTGRIVPILNTSNNDKTLHVSPLNYYSDVDESLSNQIEMFDDASNWNNHVELGLWADLFLVAPCSANTLAKMANGACDNLLLATYLSAKCLTAIAPAMDLDMWKHSATQRNIQLVQRDGVHVIPVGNGELASGLNGEGRLAEPEDILTYLNNEFFN